MRCDCGHTFEPEIHSHKIYCGDNTEILPKIKNADLCVTSPPYDDLRTYDGHKKDFDFEKTADALSAAIDDGGVIVWVVNDQIVKGSKTLTSLKQAEYFAKLGFKIHDIMIYGKNSMRYPDKRRYSQQWEYMIILTKTGPKTFNPRKNTTNEAPHERTSTNRNPDGSLRRDRMKINALHTAGNVWVYDAGFMKTTKDKIAYEHPAIFPDALARDHIESWSDKGDTVIEPFLGSGTVLMQCEKSGRTCIGIEINPVFVDICIARFETVTGKKAVKA